MPVRRYRLRLRIDTAEPVAAAQLLALRGGRWEVTAHRRGGQLHIGMVMDSVDVASALTRALNVLDAVGGEVVAANVVATEEPVTPVPRPRRRGRRRRGGS